MRVRYSLAAVLFAALLVTILPAAPGANSGAFPVAEAQSRTVFWRRWDVTIDNVDTTNNHFDVTESYDLTFTGSFHYGSRVIPLNNLTDIRNVSVSQGGQPLQASCSQAPGTFCASESSSQMTINYYFLRSITNGQASFDLHYTIDGALRAYSGGDQLWWSAIPSDHFGFSIGGSTVNVTLPDGFAPRKGTDPVVTYGAPADVQVEGTHITATATGQLSGQDSLDIRVQYPHDPNAKAPAWQSSFDQTRQFQENVQPLINIGIIVVSLLIALGGPLLIYALYMSRGRDPKVGPVPEFLTELPSNLSPAVVGTLIDEHADVRDVMSILLDLAHRGYLVIEEEQKEGLLGIGHSSEFTFKRTDKADTDLKPYETRLMDNVFKGSAMERTLDSMRDKFYMVIPQIQNDLYDALVREGLFPDKPSNTRLRWSLVGSLLIGLAVVAVVLCAAAAETYGGAIMCIPFAVGIAGAFAMIVGQYMPAKTQKGAEEAARWNAFLEYLRHLEKYGDVKDAAVHFDDFLPYAVAFGLDRTWMQRFRSVPNVPVPYWYYPTYLGGPYRRGYAAGTPLSPAGVFGGQGGLPGGLASAGQGGVSLNQMSGNLSGGLEHLSTGLSTMLDSASRAMTSRPQSASTGSSGHWSGGGGSWSGGGFSGGGFSGGGHSGFG